MMEILQDDNLGQTLRNPWVARGWWRTGTLGAKSTEREKKKSNEKKEKRKNKLEQKNLLQFFYFSILIL